MDILIHFLGLALIPLIILAISSGLQECVDTLRSHFGAEQPATESKSVTKHSLTGCYQV